MTLAATNYDASHERHITADEAASTMERTQWLRRTSWGAILAGAISAIGLQALFTVLGAAIGVSSYAGQGVDSAGVGLFAGIWWVISGTVSLLAGGLIVGRMITIPRNAELLVHGFTMWAVTAIFGVMFLWSSAGMVGSVGAESLEGTSAIPSVNQAVTGDAVNRRAADVRASATAASWWTLGALVVGVGASIAGTYIGAAPLSQKSKDKSYRPQTA